MKEYRIAKHWALFMYITGPLLIILFLWLLLAPFFPSLSSGIPPNAYWFLAPLSLGMIILIFLGIIDTKKGKLIIDDERILLIGVFSEKELTFSDIKGYRLDDKYVTVEPRSRTLKKLKITRYTGNVDEVIEWLGNNYSDLDEVGKKEDVKKILGDKKLGITSEERYVKLNNAKKVARVLNAGGLMTGLWALFYPHPYDITVILLMLIPVTCIIAMRGSGGLIRATESKANGYPSVFAAMFMCCLVIFIRALLDFDILDYKHAGKLTAWVTGALLIVTFIGNRALSLKKKNNLLTLCVLTFLIAAFAYGSVIVANCYFDKGQSENYMASVLDMHINNGKSTTYNLELSPWGIQKKSSEVTVSKDFYNHLKKNMIVVVSRKPGRLGISWFLLSMP